MGRGEDIDIDSENNIYTIGKFGEAAYSVYDSNITINKTNSLGISIWSDVIEYEEDDIGYGIKVNVDDNVYITGVVNESFL